MEAATQMLRPAEVLLDIGCGIMPQRLLLPKVHVCCEPFAQYVGILRESIRDERDRSWLILQASWEECVTIFSEQSVDTVILMDVIEHLDHGDGVRLLRATEAIARQQVVVFTPLGFMPQHHEDGRDAWGLEGGTVQEHRSGWLPEDFAENWDVIATRRFHFNDNAGNPLPEPFGALFAIKTHVLKEVVAPLAKAEAAAHAVLGRAFRYLRRRARR